MARSGVRKGYGRPKGKGEPIVDCSLIPIDGKVVNNVIHDL